MTDRRTAEILAKTLRCLESRDTNGIVLSTGLASAAIASASFNPAIIGTAFLTGATVAGLGRIAYCGHAAWSDVEPPPPPQKRERAGPVQAKLQGPASHGL